MTVYYVRSEQTHSSQSSLSLGLQSIHCINYKRKILFAIQREIISIVVDHVVVFFTHLQINKTKESQWFMLICETTWC